MEDSHPPGRRRRPPTVESLGQAYRPRDRPVMHGIAYLVCSIGILVRGIGTLARGIAPVVRGMGSLVHGIDSLRHSISQLVHVVDSLVRGLEQSSVWCAYPSPRRGEFLW